jgi:hypothetical protein
MAGEVDLVWTGRKLSLAHNTVTGFNDKRFPSLDLVALLIYLFKGPMHRNLIAHSCKP